MNDGAKKCIDRAGRLWDSGRAELAARVCTNYLKKNLDDGSVWQLYGRILSELGEDLASVEALEHASLLIPLVAEAELQLAAGYIEIGKTAWAREYLVGLLERPAIDPELLIRAGALLDRIELPNYAVRACRNAIQMGLESAQAHFDLSYYLARCGAPTHIVSGLAYKAIELDPQQICYRLAFARYLAKHGRCEEAIDILDPLSREQLQQVTCQGCLHHVQELYERVGNWPLARICLMRRRELSCVAES